MQLGRLGGAFRAYTQYHAMTSLTIKYVEKKHMHIYDDVVACCSNISKCLYMSYITYPHRITSIICIYNLIYIYYDINQYIYIYEYMYIFRLRLHGGLGWWFGSLGNHNFMEYTL